MCVIDLSPFDDLLGIEIIGFKEQLGQVPPVGNPTSGETDSDNVIPRWSYHPKGDAFYLQLKKERAPKQREVLGLASFDRDGAVVCLQVDIAGDSHLD